jgi:hypothetical protein
MISNVGLSNSFLSILGKEALIVSPWLWGGRGGLAQIHERREKKRNKNRRKKETAKVTTMPPLAVIE